MYFPTPRCKVGAVAIVWISIWSSYFFFFELWGNENMHCSYLMLAKHFEVPQWRLLDLKCTTACFYKSQKYKVLFWQKEYLEILDLLKTVASLATKSILAIMSVGQISACVIITAGWVLNRSALPVKAISWWLRLTVAPHCLDLWTALLA